MSPKRPTIKDVARVAGVSFKTVSRVINGQQGVSEEVRRKVRRAIAELGYVVNYSARSLATGGSTTLGVVMPRISSPHLLHLMFHLGLACEKHDLALIISTRPAVADVLDMSSFLGHGLVGALLLVAPRRLRRLMPLTKALQIPTVVTETIFVDDDGQPIEAPIPCVASDQRTGSAEGVAHLVGLGHRRIAYIGGGTGSQTRLREMGYRDALASHGLGVDEALVRAGDWSMESGEAQVAELLALAERPSAVFCASDSMAFGALRGAKRLGLRVPDELSVLGFDDIPWAGMAEPPLTTVHQPVPELTERAVGLVAAALKGEELLPGNILLPTRLIERGSCCPPAARR